MQTLSASNLVLAHLDAKAQAPFSFVLKRGEICGLLGRNGCGKSTLLHTLAGLLPPAAGQVLLAQEDLQTLPRKIIAKNVGILLQNHETTLQQTVYHYCLGGRFAHSNWLGPTAADEAMVMQSLLQMDLLAHANRYIATLSGGERKRLEIATLLAQAPLFFLLDEPTNHLDINHQMQLLTHLQTLAKSKQAGILVASHDIHLVLRFCHKVILIFPTGQIHQGRCEDLLTNETLSRAFNYPLQLLTEQNGS